LKLRCPLCQEKVRRKAYDRHLLEVHEVEGWGEGEIRPFTCYDDCAACCLCPVLPVSLSIEDLKRMASHVGTTVGRLYEEACSVVGLPAGDGLSYFPIVTFRFPCKFLKEKRCSIYPARPKSCRLFPTLFDSDPLVYRGHGLKCIDRGAISFTPEEQREARRLLERQLEEMKRTSRFFRLGDYGVRLSEEDLSALSRAFEEKIGKPLSLSTDPVKGLVIRSREKLSPAELEAFGVLLKERVQEKLEERIGTAFLEKARELDATG
jgi:Fe-S-cluster containining protein